MSFLSDKSWSFRACTDVEKGTTIRTLNNFDAKVPRTFTQSSSHRWRGSIGPTIAIDGGDAINVHVSSEDGTCRAGGIVSAKERQRWSVCVCVCVCEKERERERERQ